MLRDILGALEFVAFLGGLAWLCYRIERLPVYRRLNAKLFPEVNDDRKAAPEAATSEAANDHDVRHVNLDRLIF